MAGEVGIGATTGGMQLGAAGGVLGAGLFAAELVSGPVGWGIAIGGAALGALSGGFGGSKARKARKYARRAARVQQQREANAAEATFLQQIREGRITRAASSASAAALGISTSSLSTSALSSIGSQTGYNMQYLAEDRRLYSLYSRYMRKAGRAAQDYKNVMALQSATSKLAMTAGSFALNNPTLTASLFASGATNTTGEWLGINSGNRVNDAAFGVTGTYA